MVLIFVRSLIFNIVFYINLLFLVIAGIPTYLMPRSGVVKLAQTWGITTFWLMRLIVGTKIEFRGLERIPDRAAPLLIAAKHQSIWETFALLQFFDEPLYILKRELKWIPLFGWYLHKSGMIGVNRGAGGRTLVEMTRKAREEVLKGRQLIIFPEGTRRPVDAPPRYKYGVSQIYVECGVPCVPVALNSGLFWPRRTFLRYPGTIVVEFLDPIPPGLNRDEFTDRVSDAIETATNRLVADGRKEQEALIGFSAPVQPASS